MLVKERDREASYELLEERVAEGMRALCITRDPPEIVARHHRLAHAEQYWLITRARPNAVDPFDLPRLGRLVLRFLGEHPESVVFLDGIEFLLVLNDYGAVKTFLSDVDAAVRRKGSSCIVPLDARTLAREELEDLTRSFAVLTLTDLRNAA
jgi:hypothetical protein